MYYNDIALLLRVESPRLEYVFLNPDDTLGGHQRNEVFGLDDLPMNTDTYYVQQRLPSTRHGGSENIVYEFVVHRNSDLVIINGSERMNKVCARMRWNHLIGVGWKQVHHDNMKVSESYDKYMDKRNNSTNYGMTE